MVFLHHGIVGRHIFRQTQSRALGTYKVGWEAVNAVHRQHFWGWQKNLEWLWLF